MTKPKINYKKASELRVDDKLYGLHYGEYHINREISVYLITKVVSEKRDSIKIYAKVLGQEKLIAEFEDEDTFTTSYQSVFFTDKRLAESMYLTVQNLHNKKIDSRINELKEYKARIAKTPKFKFVTV